ncbi:MAG: YgaP family membrane protein [Marinomonas sp.]
MKKNLNSLDRIIRGVVGIVFTGFALFNGEYLQKPILEVLLGVFGALNLISLFFGWCPVYHLAGINTYKKKHD